MKQDIIRLLLLIALSISPACNSHISDKEEDFFRNPIIANAQSTAFYYHEGMYYYVRNDSGHIMISAMKDPADFRFDLEKSACNMIDEHNLVHLWHPQLKRIDNTWYIYVTGDDGDTDNHKMYVLENKAENPMDGNFVMKGKITTDERDNWAMHGHVFEHNGSLYMVWSGWESRRVFVEKQFIYIASMDTPWSLSSDRIKISEPEYEWELQWIQRDGSSSTRYPVYVNECPIYFCNEFTEKVHIYYSASANWTAYHCIGELTAEKDADLLNPASWKKTETPVFKENREAEIFCPDMPYIIPSESGKDFYLIYSATKTDARGFSRSIYCQPITIQDGRPELGKPFPRETPIRRISTLQ